jgi:hypothetical protein
MKSSVLCFILSLASTLCTSLANLLDPLNPQEGAATELSQKFQPALDFDKDSCYHVVALDLGGHYNEGLEPYHPKGTENCRTGDHLMHSNAYVRRRCNHYWCAYMYGYYFEKDEGILGGSHTHDWEHVIVWTLHDNIVWISWSAHGAYESKHITDSALHFHEGTHIKIVYHLGGWGTHSMRLATNADEPPDNHWGQWFVAWLVELTWMEPWSKMLVEHDWGSAHPDMNGDDFGRKLSEYAPWDAIHNEGFDPWSDADTFVTTSLLPDMGLRGNISLSDESVEQEL